MVKGVPTTVDLRDRIEDTEAMLLADNVFLNISRHSREHVFTRFDKIWPLLTADGRMTGKYVFMGTKTGFSTIKEYLSKHFHATIQDQFPELDWSQLTITLCSPPHFQGPASVIFPIPLPTPLPPAIDNAPAHLPETVTPAPKTRDGMATAIGASPRHLPLPRVMESPLLGCLLPLLLSSVSEKL